MIPLVILFLLVNVVCFLLNDSLVNNNIDPKVIIGSNALFFLIAVVSGYLRNESLKNPNPNVSVRSVMGSSVIKIFIIAIAAIIYLFTVEESRSIYAVIVSMLLYIPYAILETRGILKLNKK